MDLVANNLSYKPDDQYHLNEVSFNFKEGNLYTILGRTLSGKTTLLKTIAGLLTPDSGEIEFDGKKFFKSSSLGKKCSNGLSAIYKLSSFKCF